MSHSQDCVCSSMLPARVGGHKDGLSIPVPRDQRFWVSSHLTAEGLTLSHLQFCWTFELWTNLEKSNRMTSITGGLRLVFWLCLSVTARKSFTLSLVWLLLLVERFSSALCIRKYMVLWGGFHCQLPNPARLNAKCVIDRSCPKINQRRRRLTRHLGLGAQDTVVWAGKRMESKI